MSKRKAKRSLAQSPTQPMTLEELAAEGYGDFNVLEDKRRGKGLAVTADGSLDAGKVQYTPTALVIDGNLTEDEWLHVGKFIRAADEARQWWAGDWLLHGDWPEGEKFATASEILGKDEKTLRNYQWVASRFPMSLRRDTLFFAHHEVVAGMRPEDRERWLDRAEPDPEIGKRRWSQKRLIDEIAGTDRVTGTIDRFSRFLSQSRARYQSFGKRFSKASQVEKQQAEHMIDEQIAELDALKRSLWDK